MPYITGSGTLITPESPSGVEVGVVAVFFCATAYKTNQQQSYYKTETCFAVKIFQWKEVYYLLQVSFNFLIKSINT
jgi:hypothetical protein